MTWAVEVVRYSDEIVVKTLNYPSEGLAERGERGVLRNMNTEDYFTRVVQVSDTTLDKQS